jgi:hypothetical protein
VLADVARAQIVLRGLTVGSFLRTGRRGKGRFAREGEDELAQCVLTHRATASEQRLQARFESRLVGARGLELLGKQLDLRFELANASGVLREHGEALLVVGDQRIALDELTVALCELSVALDELSIALDELSVPLSETLP